MTDYKLVKSNYRNEWLKIRKHRLMRHFEYERQIPFSDFKAFSEVVKTLPTNVQLQLANSAAIRYTQLFDLHQSLQVFCNRGTSGIDGSTSTAIGAASVSKLPTVLITGDLSFLYDSNGLLNQYIPKHFSIIIINNCGGGIFRILPGEKDTTNFSDYFETKHEFTAVQLAEMFGFEYTRANDEVSLKIALDGFYDASEAPKILEVFTPSEVNNTVLLDYFDFIK